MCFMVWIELINKCFDRIGGCYVYNLIIMWNIEIEWLFWKEFNVKMGKLGVNVLIVSVFWFFSGDIYLLFKLCF